MVPQVIVFLLSRLGNGGKPMVQSELSGAMYRIITISVIRKTSFYYKRVHIGTIYVYILRI